MLADAFPSGLGVIASALFLFAGVYIYVSLIRQISARKSATESAVAVAPAKTFGLPEAILAAALVFVSLAQRFRFAFALRHSTEQPRPCRQSSRDDSRRCFRCCLLEIPRA